MLSCGSMGELNSNQKMHAACQQIGTAHQTHNVWRVNHICLKHEGRTAKQLRRAHCLDRIRELPLPLTNATQRTDERLLAERTGTSPYRRHTLCAPAPNSSCTPLRSNNAPHQHSHTHKSNRLEA